MGIGGYGELDDLQDEKNAPAWTYIRILVCKSNQSSQEAV